MRKYLLLLIVPFLFLNNVYAEEYKECFNEFLVGDVTITDYLTYNKRIRPSLVVEAGKTYYVRFFASENYTCSTNNTCFGNFLAWDNQDQAMQASQALNFKYNMDSGYDTFDKETQILEFTTKANTNVHWVAPLLYTYNSNWNALSGAKMIISDNKEDVLSCISEEPVIDIDNPVIAFYSIYLDKLGMIADYSLENKYLLSFIGIILVFILLELFLFLFKGGRRR